MTQPGKEAIMPMPGIKWSGIFLAGALVAVGTAVAA